MTRILPIISVLLLLIIIAAGWFLWWPKYQEVKDLRFQLEIKEKALSDKQEHFSKLNDISKKLEEYKDSVAKIDSALPDSVSEPDLYNFIQNTSSSSGLILKKIGPAKISTSQAEGEIKEIQDITFAASVAGSYSAFKDFLSNIYQSSRLIEADSIKFSSPEKGTNLFEIDLTFLTHYLSKPAIQEQTP